MKTNKCQVSGRVVKDRLGVKWTIQEEEKSPLSLKFNVYNPKLNEGKPIGYVFFKIDTKDKTTAGLKIEIPNPKYRKRCIGSSLYKYAEPQIKNYGVTKITDTVSAQDKEEYEWKKLSFEKLGFSWNPLQEKEGELFMATIEKSLEASG